VIRLVLAALLLLVATSVEAALPAPPFDLALSSTSLREGDTVTVRVSARPGGAAQDRYDLYVLLASVEEAAFLTPEGTWAPRPVPYARAVSTSDPPLVRQWPKVWPPGQYALGLVAVAPSGDPLDRAAWRYRPAIRWFQVAPLRPERAAPVIRTWVLLGVAAVAAGALVWWAGAGLGASASGP
jgi:hypothetical protein